MPQGPDHLHERWGDDGAAWQFLKERGFTHVAFVIQAKPGHAMTDDEQSAIEYLILEWDWDYQRIV